MLNNDILTSIVKRVIDIMLIKRPTETILGAMLGGILNSLSKVFQPAYANNPYFSFSKLQWYEWVIFAIFLTNFQHFFKREKFDPSIEQAYEVIKLSIKEGNLSEQEQRQLYRNLCNVVLANVQIDDSYYNGKPE